MQFSEDLDPSDNIITRYGSGFVDVRDERHTRSIFVFPDQPVEPWACDQIGAVTTDNLATLIDYRPELVVIGSGPEFAFPDIQVQLDLQQRGIGCEIMASAAACRTYNVLVSERRRVVAALLLP